MTRPKKTAYAALGWLAWQALARVGVPLAKRRIAERGRGTQG